MSFRFSVATIFILLVLGCQHPADNNRNLHFRIENLVELNMSSVEKVETIYVPVYTDVYHIDQSRLFPLTVTLSLRNTSLNDTLKVLKVNYYNSDGQLVKQHIKANEMLLLHPLESFELVIDKKTYTGDTGANYIVEWAGKDSGGALMVQALMINTSGQQGLSFITDGITIDSKLIKP